MHQVNTALLTKTLAKYSTKFEAKRSFIDMRTMSKNFPGTFGVIPWSKLEELNELIIGPPPVKNKFDPRQLNQYTLELGWEPIMNFGILTEIQRDLIPAHIYDIEVSFDSKKISVVLAMEDPVTGMICPFDGHHTARVLSRQGWTHAPCFVLRATPEMIKEDPLEARKHLMRIAGEAFLSINLTHKKGVGGYDKFIIMRDYGDPEAIDIANILKDNKAKAVRIARDPGDISHYPFLWGAYDLRERNFGSKGRYLDMSLEFHNKTWPMEQIYGATLIGLANFFHKCERFKIVIDKSFADDLSKALKNTYKLSKFTHLGYKADYERAHPYGSASDEMIVTCGFVHTYNKHVGKVSLYTPELQFGVK